MANKLTIVQRILLKYFYQDIRVLIKEDDYDSLLKSVIEFIQDKDFVEPRDLQIYFRIGYGRACKIINQLQGLKIIPSIRQIDKIKAIEFLKNK